MKLAIFSRLSRFEDPEIRVLPTSYILLLTSPSSSPKVKLQTSGCTQKKAPTGRSGLLYKNLFDHFYFAAFLAGFSSEPFSSAGAAAVSSAFLLFPLRRVLFAASLTSPFPLP